MRLFEAILDANHRALAGDQSAGLRPSEFAEDFPVVALTCIDARLNRLMPEVLGVPEEQFIWLRNAGNIITSPLSSTMRSLALACAIKGGKEIAIIGHSDCLVGKFSILNLTDRFRALGIGRDRLPENLTEFFGTFASETQNVIKAVDFVRQSPLIGPTIPVHGLLVDINTGRLDWLVNGYQTLGQAHTQTAPLFQAVQTIGRAVENAEALKETAIGAASSVQTKIGELTTEVEKWLAKAGEQLSLRKPEEPETAPPALAAPAPPQLPPKIPLPPRFKPKLLPRRRQ